MLELVRKSAVIPRIPTKALFATGTMTAFVWLLAQDLIHPIVIYLLQLYLVF